MPERPVHTDTARSCTPDLPINYSSSALISVNNPPRRSVRHFQVIAYPVEIA